LQKLIEGYQVRKKDRVLLVDDVLTSGSSVLHAVHAVEALGARVAQITCLVDREEGARELLRSYKFTPLFSRSEIEQGNRSE
jgi:orotate phosphoribosyltransferase